MALLDFPSGPSVGQSTTQNGNTWKWNGTSWVAFNNVSLTSQVTGILAVDYGGTGFGGTFNKGDILYALSSNTFGKLAAGTAGSVLSINNNQDLYWKVDDTGAGTVGSGTSGGFAYYTSTTNITSGSGFSYIGGGGNNNVVIVNGLLSLIGSTINSGTWAGSAITLAYGGTNNTISGVGHSYRVAMFDAAGTAITNISSAGTANSVLFQSGQTVSPTWVGQNTLIVGGATTAANIQGGLAGSIPYQSSANTTTFLNNPGAGYALTTVSATSVAYQTISSLFVGSAFGATNVTTVDGSSSNVYLVGNINTSVGQTQLRQSGTSVYVNGTTLYATSFSGTATSAQKANNIIGGLAGSIPYQSSADTTTFLNNPGAGYALTTVSASSVAYQTISSLAVGSAFGTTNITTVDGSSSNIYIVGNINSSVGQTQLRQGGTSVYVNGGTVTATNFSGLATSASNILGGVASAGSSIHIQTGVNTTGFLAHPGSAGQALTTTASGLVYGALTSLAVTSVSAGTAIQVSANTGAVTITNNGVHSVTGTTNRVNISASTGGTGAVTVTLPNTVVVNEIQVDGPSSTLATVGSQPTSMVNKQYVDNLASGLDVHASVRLVLNTAIGASYYQPNYGIGNTATGAYLTSIGNATFPAIDGITIASTGASQRVLITGGLTGAGKTSINGSALVTPADSNLVNGIYYVGSVGSGSSQWYLYRATDTDDNTELTGGTFTFVEEGSTYKDSAWVCTNDTTNLGPVQFGSTAITFSQFAGAAAFSSGQGLTKVGNTFATNVNLSATGTASGTGYSQFNIGGPSVGGAADTGYYPTFSVRTGTIHAGTSLLTLNHTGFSLTGSTNTPATLTVTGNISLPNPGTAYGIAYASDSNTVAFSTAGNSGQIFKSNGSSAPTWIDQSTIIAGGATTAAQWQTSRTVTFATGDVTGSFSINGSADVSNVALTIAANSVALGTDTTGNYAQSVAVAGSGLTLGGTAGEGTDFTVYSNGTSANTVSTLVFRDSSGNFSAGTITANLTGTATTATRVGITSNNTSSALPLVFADSHQPSAALGSTVSVTVNPNTSTITAVNFSGNATTATNSGASGQWSASRTVTFATGDVTGSFSINGSADVNNVALTIAANSVALGTDTTGNYTGSVAVAGSGLTLGGTAGEGTDFTVYSNGTSANTVSTLVFRDSSGNFSAGTITANLTGTATTATRVGITTTVTDGNLPIVFASDHQPSTALGSSTLLTYNPSNGKITNGIWAGTAITTGRGGTGLITVSPNQILLGASTGNTWAAVGSSVVPVVAIGAAAPAQPGGAIGATQAGQLWWDSEYGVLKVYYVDATPTAQWVDATPVLGSSGGGSSTKRSYVMTFGAGFTPSTGADTVQIQIPYAPDNTSKYYYIKRLDYRNESVSSGAGVSFYIERYTGTGAFNIATSGNRIHSGAGLSFVAAAGIYITSYTLSSTGASFVSSAGVAGSVISGDYLRLNFAAINSAATMSVSMVIEEQ